MEHVHGVAGQMQLVGSTNRGHGKSRLHCGVGPADDLC